MPTKPQTKARVVAITSFVGGLRGKDVVVQAGAEFDATDPVVRAWPQLFRAAADPEPIIEHATAAPGEKRGE